MADSISDIIENFLLETLGSGESINISRNELAEHFSCAPSQINYVLSTRFTVERGFITESRRGGGGYVQLVRIQITRHSDFLSEIISEIQGQNFTFIKARHIVDRLLGENYISVREAEIIKSAVSDKAFADKPPYIRNDIRSQVFSSILLCLLKENNPDDVQRV